MRKAISSLILTTVLLIFPAFLFASQFQVTVDPNVTRDQVIVSKIRDDIATQFAIFESYFGTKSLVFEVIVYPTYKSVKQPLLGISNSSRINLVLPGFFYKSTGKTRTIYNDLLGNLYPYSSPTLRQAIAQFLSNEFYGVDSTQLASISRYSFHDMPIPDSIDANTQNHSISDRLSAKFKKIAIGEGNASLGFFLDKALNDGLSYAIQEKYKQDFKAFVRSTPLVSIPKSFDKESFKNIYASQAELWRKLPQKPIPLDTAWREDSQTKLELAKILLLKDSKEQVQTMISEVNQTIQARDAESFSWWFIAVFLFLIIVFCFGLTLKLSSSYGTVRSSSGGISKIKNPEPVMKHIAPDKQPNLVKDQPFSEKTIKPRFRGRPATRVDANSKIAKGKQKK